MHPSLLFGCFQLLGILRKLTRVDRAKIGIQLFKRLLIERPTHPRQSWDPVMVIAVSADVQVLLKIHSKEDFLTALAL